MTPLEYAKRGWRVIPIPPGKKFPEGITRWQERATNDPELVTQWWEQHPDHGVGIARAGDHVRVRRLQPRRERGHG